MSVCVGFESKLAVMPSGNPIVESVTVPAYQFSKAIETGVLAEPPGLKEMDPVCVPRVNGSVGLFRIQRSIGSWSAFVP